MRILITGGAGFIGSHLAEALVGEGHDISILDDLSNGTINNLASIHGHYKFIRGDVAINGTITKDYEAIFHLACWPRSRSFSDPFRDVEVNINGMVNVLEIARRSDAKVIFSSNSGIYGTCKLPITEDSPDDPKTPYDLNKLTAEKYLELYYKTYGIDYTIFRFATVYGPRQRTSEEWKPVVMEFIDKLSQGLTPTIYWNGEQTRDFIYVDDIVKNLVSALKWTLKGPIILATGKETSINELYDIISRKLNVAIQPRRAPMVLGDIPRMQYKENGYAQITVEEGINRIMRVRLISSIPTLQSFSSNPMRDAEI